MAISVCGMKVRVSSINCHGSHSVDRSVDQGTSMSAKVKRRSSTTEREGKTRGQKKYYLTAVLGSEKNDIKTAQDLSMTRGSSLCILFVFYVEP